MKILLLLPWRFHLICFNNEYFTVKDGTGKKKRKQTSTESWLGWQKLLCKIILHPLTFGLRESRITKKRVHLRNIGGTPNLVFLNAKSRDEWGSDDVRKLKINHKFASKNNDFFPHLCPFYLCVGTIGHKFKFQTCYTEWKATKETLLQI